MNRSFDHAGLALLLRAIPGPPETIARITKGLDLVQVIHAASANGLTEMVSYHLQQAEVALTATVQRLLLTQALGAAAAVSRLRSVLLSTLDTLASEGIVPIILKGYGLASRIYRNPVHRGCSDIDLLVAGAELAPAERALKQLNFRRLDEQVDSHQIPFTKQDGTIDLHHSLQTVFSTRFDVNKCIQRSQEGRLEGRAIRYLCPEDELLYLAVHAAGHHFARLTWLFDLKLFLLRYQGLDWDILIRRATDSFARGALYLALVAGQQVVEVNVPASVMSRIRPPHWRATWVERFWKTGLAQRSFMDRKWSSYATTLFVPDTWGGVMKYVHSGVSNWTRNQFKARNSRQ